MRKHLSVLAFIARQSILKILSLFLIMAGIQFALFYAVPKSETLTNGGIYTVMLEEVFDESKIVWVFGIAFLLLTFVLARTGCNFGSHPSYTLRRLSVSEKTVFLWQFAYNTACFFIFWVFETLVVYLLAKYYIVSVDSSAVHEQTLFLAFYRNDFLHSLLPLESVTSWYRNIIYVVTMSIVSAAFPYKRRRGKKGMGIVFITLYTASAFLNGLVPISLLDLIGALISMSKIGILIFLAVIAEALVFVYIRGDKNEEIEKKKA